MSDDSILRDILDALNRVADGVEELKEQRKADATYVTPHAVDAARNTRKRR